MDLETKPLRKMNNFLSDRILLTEKLSRKRFYPIDQKFPYQRLN